MTPFFMAWQMFLWIPSPVHPWDESKKKEMLLNLPLVGLILGSLWYGLFLLFRYLRPDMPLFLGALLGVFPWLVTGFMHMDGFMDCSDAALYFGTGEKKLAILKDSHVGSFAVICTAILVVLQCSAFIQIGKLSLTAREALVLVFIPGISRCLVVDKIFRWEPLPTSSYVGLREGVRKWHICVTLLLILLFAAAIGFLCGWKILVCVLIGILVQELSMRYLKHNLGAMSGDISGAGLTTGELACLAALSLLS